MSIYGNVRDVVRRMSIYGHCPCRGVAQTLIIRDWWLCTVLSIMFEVMEYTMEHQLANFSECWWDHVGSHPVSFLAVRIFNFLLKDLFVYSRDFVLV